MVRASEAALKLKALRERTGLTVQQVADAIKRPKSTYASYEDKYKKPFLPVDLVRDLADVFAPHGISSQELFTLAGVERGSGQAKGVIASRPRANADGMESVMIKELDIRAAAGGGAADPSDVDAEAPVVGEWQVPTAWIQQISSRKAPDLRVIPVIGDSMEPLFHSSTRVFVDIGDTVPSPPGIFVVWDGLGLVVKRVEHLPHSDPPTVEISSANPAYKPYKRTLTEAHIWGRVIGRWLPT